MDPSLKYIVKVSVYYIYSFAFPLSLRGRNILWWGVMLGLALIQPSSSRI